MLCSETNILLTGNYEFEFVIIFQNKFFIPMFVDKNFFVKRFLKIRDS